MNILITNDDGILAPGIHALANAVKDFGMISVVAPETPQSASAHSITLNDPLMCTKVELPGNITGYSVRGRPADCVKLAMVEICPSQCPHRGKPDLVISGINAGANIGINVLYSGTVAAAIESAFFDIPAIAISLAIKDKVDFDYAGKIAKSVIKLIVDNNMTKPGYVLNVNIPPCEYSWPKGIKVVPQSTQSGKDHFEKREDPRGRTYYWLAGDENQTSEDSRTDISCVNDGYLTITPLMFDLTAHGNISELNGIVSKCSI